MSRVSVAAVAAVLWSGALANSGSAWAQPITPESVVSEVEGTTITASEVDAEAGTPLLTIRSQEYNIRKRALDRLVGARLIALEAKKLGVSVAALEQKEIDARITEPTDEEIEAIYASASDKFPGQSEASARETITNGVRQRRKEARRQALIAEIRARYNVRTTLEPPRFPVGVDDDPVDGPATAPVTIVAFSDFQCPYCARAADTVRELRRRFPNDVRIVFRDFPLPSHSLAVPAAEAAQCAGEQGKFWETHDRLFAEQRQISDAYLKELPKVMGLDSAKYAACLTTLQRAQEWRRDRDDGAKFGVSATPTFFVNGRVVAGALPLQQFVDIVNEELSRSKRK
jgi:protein-disulfide isomerase